VETEATAGDFSWANRSWAAGFFPEARLTDSGSVFSCELDSSGRVNLGATFPAKIGPRFAHETVTHTCADRSKVVTLCGHKFLDNHLATSNQCPSGESSTGHVDECVKDFALASCDAAGTESATSHKQQGEFRTPVQVR
jgi:hypothetical protein